ncbi:MAG: hypothetical protein AB1782_20370 [Cyanobacteriota bacterium]
MINTPYNVMNLVGATPTGSKLLNEAARQGVNIQFLPNNGDNVIGQYDPTSNTVSVEENDLETMVEVLSHELVHSTTPGNGNSLEEEYSAFLVGEKVAGEAGVDYNPHSNSFWSDHVKSSYGDQGLVASNGILNDLGMMGIELPGLGSTGGNLTPGLNLPGSEFTASGGIGAMASAGSFGAFAAAGNLNSLLGMNMGGGLNIMA